MFREFEYIDGVNPFLHSIEYCVDGLVVGYLDYQLIYDRIEIDDFLVRVEYRNRGIGRMLMSYLIGIGIRDRVVNITLEVRKSNEVARGLYRSFGFREVALRRFYYGDEDGILMEKQVM